MNNIEQIKIDDTAILHRPATGGVSEATLILLHGYGADEYDLMGLSPYFDEAIQMFCIRGPGETPYGGASWFDIEMLSDGSLKFNTEQAKESTQLVLRLIDRMQNDGLIKNEKIIIGGFSQGASISNLITLLKPELIQALLVMSGRLPDHIEGMVQDASKYSRIPIFAGHGTLDQVIPIEYGRQIVSFWEKLAVLEHYEYPMGHEISQSEIEHIQNWLQSILH